MIKLIYLVLASLLIAVHTSYAIEIKHPYQNAKPGDVAEYRTSVVLDQDMFHLHMNKTFKILSNNGNTVRIEEELPTINKKLYYTTTLNKPMDLDELLKLKKELNIPYRWEEKNSEKDSLIIDGQPINCDVALINIYDKSTDKLLMKIKTWMSSQGEYHGIVQMDTIANGKLQTRMRLMKTSKQSTEYNHDKIEQLTGYVSLFDTRYDIQFPVKSVKHAETVVESKIHHEYSAFFDNCDFKVATENRFYGEYHRQNSMASFAVTNKEKQEVYDLNEMFDHNSLRNILSKSYNQINLISNEKSSEIIPGKLEYLSIPVSIACVCNIEKTTTNGPVYERSLFIPDSHQLIQIRVSGNDKKVVEKNFNIFIESLCVSTHTRKSPSLAKKCLEDGLVNLQKLYSMHKELSNLNRQTRNQGFAMIDAGIEERQFGINKAILAGELNRLVKTAYPENQELRNKYYDEIEMYDKSMLSTSNRE